MFNKIKQHVVSSLTYTQKEALKTILRRFKLYASQPDPEQVYLEAAIQDLPKVFFIQIGANDGHDFVRRVLGGQYRKRKISGILIEPQPYYYNKLRSTYAGMSDIEILNVAISDTDEALTLFYIDYDDRDLPSWTKGLGSLNKEVLLSHSHLIEDLPSRIRQLEVRCMPVGELLKKAGGAQLDILVTDTEGHDFVILKQFDFAVVRPKLIIYESKHLAKRDLAACEQMLSAVGYQVTKLGNDNSVAVLNSIADRVSAS